MSTARFVLREYMDNGKIRADVLVVPLPANLTQEEIKAKIQPIIDKHRAAWENQTPNLSDPTIRDWKHISTGGVHVSDASGKDTTVKEPDNVKKVVKEATALFQEVFLSINTRADEITATSQVQRLQQTLGQPQHLLEDFLNRKLDAQNITGDSLTERLSLYESHVKKQLKKDPKLLESAAMKYDEVRGEILDILEQNPSAVYEWGPRVVGEIVHFLSATSPKIQLLEQEYKDLVKEEFKKHLLSAMRAHKKKHPRDPASMISKHTYDDLIINEKCKDAKKILRAKGMKQAILEQLQDDPRINQALRTNEPLEKVTPIPEFKAAFRTRSPEDVIGDFATAIRKRKENSAFFERLTLLYGPGSNAAATKEIFIPCATQRLQEIKAERIRVLEESIQQHPEQAADTLETVAFLRNFPENPSLSAGGMQGFQNYFYDLILHVPNQETIETLKEGQYSFSQDPSLNIAKHLVIPDHWQTLPFPELVRTSYAADFSEIDAFTKKATVLEQDSTLSHAQKQAKIKELEKKELQLLAAKNKNKQDKELEPLTEEKRISIHSEVGRDYDRQVDNISINGESLSNATPPAWSSMDIQKIKMEGAIGHLEKQILKNLDIKIKTLIEKFQREGKPIPPYLHRLFNDPELRASKCSRITLWLEQAYNATVLDAIGSVSILGIKTQKTEISLPQLMNQLMAWKYFGNDNAYIQRNGDLDLAEDGTITFRCKDTILFSASLGEPNVKCSSALEVFLEIDFLAENGIGEARIKYQPIELKPFDPLVILMTTAHLSGSKYNKYGVLI